MSYPYQQPQFSTDSPKSPGGFILSPPPQFAPPPGHPPSNPNTQPGPPLGPPSFPQASTDHISYLGVAIPVSRPAPPLDLRAIAAGATFHNPPTLKVPGYDPHKDVELVRKACKGWGTNEELLISTLVPLNPLQIDALADQYLKSTGKTLVAEMAKECSGWFGFAIQGLVQGPLEWDTELLFKAIQGIGTNETMLNQILLLRTPTELNLLKAAFQTRYGRDLTAFVQDDLSGKVQRFFTMVLQAQQPSDSFPVDSAQVARDVEALRKAGTAVIGTDEVAFSNIIVNRSQPHLMAVSNEYEKKYGEPLLKAIKSEFSGHLESALRHIVAGAAGLTRDAELLEEAMKGMGTDNEMLVARIVRAHWDHAHMDALKSAYLSRYGETLERRLEREIKGDYKKLMLALIGKTGIR